MTKLTLIIALFLSALQLSAEITLTTDMSTENLYVGEKRAKLGHCMVNNLSNNSFSIKKITYTLLNSDNVTCVSKNATAEKGNKEITFNFEEPKIVKPWDSKNIFFYYTITGSNRKLIWKVTSLEVSIDDSTFDIAKDSPVTTDSCEVFHSLIGYHGKNILNAQTSEHESIADITFYKRGDVAIIESIELDIEGHEMLSSIEITTHENVLLKRITKIEKKLIITFENPISVDAAVYLSLRSVIKNPGTLDIKIAKIVAKDSKGRPCGLANDVFADLLITVGKASSIKGRELEIENVTGKVDVKVFTPYGKEVFSYSKYQAPGKVFVRLSDLEEGMYIVRINNHETKKIFLQR